MDVGGGTYLSFKVVVVVVVVVVLVITVDTHNTIGMGMV